MTESQLKKEFEFYLAHQSELVRDYNGKVVVIKDEKVLNVFNTPLEAVTETQKHYPLGTFLVQRVSPGDTAYTHTFHSRVMFG
jgi:hypothetical protein